LGREEKTIGMDTKEKYINELQRDVIRNYFKCPVLVFSIYLSIDISKSQSIEDIDR